jgi:hypothetical protein
MPDFNDRIDDFTPGADVDVRRTITSLPAGQLLTDAWLVVKEKPWHMDTEAVISKAITPVNQNGVGHIEDTGASGTAILRFDLRRQDTQLLKPNQAYHHEVKIKTDANKVSRAFVGLVIANRAVTKTLTP